MNTFEEVVTSRRSANKFLTDVKINESELDELFSLVKYAPSCFNLQHTQYLVVHDSDKKELVYEAAFRQYKIKSASAAIIVLGNKEAHHDAARIYEGMLHLGMLNQQEFDMTVSDTIKFYEQRGDAFKRDEAIRNASLSAMQFMLIAKDKGWDTCPMSGFDPEAIIRDFNIPENLVPVMLIAIGKEDKKSRRPRGYRKPTGEYVTYNSL
ncbi:nitroreductase family protein [Paenibacillus arenosi]|uniref:Nitroreductase family protein n=1 Tax=Paenibacillus arenosi TaxID=2774142 RepID=A0ABR9B1M0_9BACL|nr:nitroreductase family protein [Paenibacillus arenosi]MBD8500187.1 nitroreductase family protein [Paenibacillus arenosi]